ncbi:MAG TPA: regulatory protein RecX [Dehalococcoidales bacterium]|nr:regulatory protein RecX [Dehalococcoidales bacterium]
MENQVKKITAIKAGKNFRLKRSNIYLDGKFAFSLADDVVVQQKLQVGQNLSEQSLESLDCQDKQLRCLNAAYRLLGVRPRSRSEIVQRLARLGFSEGAINPVIEKLIRLDFLDDSAFAEYWKDNRMVFRPRSRLLLKSELRQKGIEPEIIEAAAGTLDEDGNAYRAASIKARNLSAADYPVFQKKLSGFLQRRGFSYSVTKSTVKKVWQERSGQPAAENDNEEDTGASPD